MSMADSGFWKIFGIYKNFIYFEANGKFLVQVTYFVSKVPICWVQSRISAKPVRIQNVNVINMS